MSFNKLWHPFSEILLSTEKKKLTHNVGNNMDESLEHRVTKARHKIMLHHPIYLKFLKRQI